MATELWAAQRTFARLRNKGIPAEQIKIPNLVSIIPDALRKLTFDTAKLLPEDPVRQILEEETTVTLTAGIGDLSTVEAANFLAETIDRGKIFHPDSEYPLQPLEDELQLTFPWPNAFIYFCVSGNKIKTRNTDGSRTSLTGDLTVTAIKIPTLDDLDEQLETDFLDHMEVLALPMVQKK